MRVITFFLHTGRLHVAVRLRVSWHKLECFYTYLYDFIYVYQFNLFDHCMKGTKTSRWHNALIIVGLDYYCMGCIIFQQVVKS